MSNVDYINLPNIVSILSYHLANISRWLPSDMKIYIRSRSFWWSKQRIQTINLLLSEGGCRFTRSRKHNSCQLYRSQKERCLCFIQEKVQSCTRLYGDKDSVRTNDTSFVCDCIFYYYFSTGYEVICVCVYHFYWRVVTFSLKSADIKFQHYHHRQIRRPHRVFFSHFQRNPF